MSQILQKLLLGHTFDIDIKNSIFVVLKQAVDRLDVKYSAGVFKGLSLIHISEPTRPY